jgi:beta-1,4-N-acetylglucosaminyltransferase
VRVVLVASAGGHLQQIVWMRPWWERHERVWVTFDAVESREWLAGEDVEWAFHPTNRHLGNLARNAGLAWRVLRRVRPDLVVSTGAAVAAPFFVLGRGFGARTVFIEPYDRVDGPSLTGRLVAPLADRVVLQRPEQVRFHPRGVLLGPVR